MEQRHLIVIDEQSQKDRLARIKQNLRNDGIELIYEEINPTTCTSRKEDGDLAFDIKVLKEKILSIPFIENIDIFATDYNLIGDELKGIDVVKAFYNMKPYYNKKVVIYSAQVENVIKNIITKSNDFNDQVSMLKFLSSKDIEYLSSEGQFENNFKSYIIKEPDLSIDERLSDSLLAIENSKFKCSLPGYSKQKINEIGIMIRKKGSESIALKKEIVDNIAAMITNVDGYE